VTLNISSEPTISGATEPDPKPDDTTRKALVGAVVTELTSWNPREFIRAFQHWHHGSLSLIHLNVLTLLEADGPLSMSRLAEALDVSVASMTGIVDRMEKRELVERWHDLEDRRVVVVHPAPGGAKIFQDIDVRRRKGLTKLLTRLNERELAGLVEGHRALREARTALARDLEAGVARHARGTKTAESVAKPQGVGK
jgi:DNA-binding MarR family transcriptional regulator